MVVRALELTVVLAILIALATPLMAEGQPSERHYRVGVIAPVSFRTPDGQRYLVALRERLAAHGFVEGRNLEMEAKYAREPGEARGAAFNVLSLKPDAIFTLGTVQTLGAQKATTSVPIVFAWVPDPVISGIVQDYRQPGGNTTGVTNRQFELMVKHVELVHDLVPRARQVAVLTGYFDSRIQPGMRLAEAVADRLGLKLVRAEASLYDFRWAAALADAVMSGADAVMVAVPFAQLGLSAAAQDTAREAMRHRVPVVYSDRESVELGGLISYATSPIEEVRRGADYLARVLKGESPTTLAVDQASRFELVINLKTARALGLTIPPSLLLRADQVIE